MKATNERILVVEDDEDTSFLLRKALTDAGYIVESNDTASGIVELKHEWPDLFILDMQLPLIDGLAVAKFLRVHAATKNIPIIMISAHPVQAKAKEAGIDDFLPKPFCVEDLLEIVDRCIHSAYVIRR